MRLYVMLVRCNIRKQMQYKASFALMTLGHFLATVVDFLGLAVLFARFGTLRGWTLPEAGLLYGAIHVAFAVAEMWGRGFDVFGNVVRLGDFDRMLTRPRSAALQVMASEFQLLRFGRMLQGGAVLAWAIPRVGVVWSLSASLTLAGAIAGGVLTFMGLLVLQAASCFWTTQTLEVWNMFTYGGVWTAQHPLGIYRGWFRRFFTYVVPLGFAGYVPVMALLGRGGGALAQLLPLPVGGAFFALSFLFWRMGVRKYCSTGS